MMEKVRQGEIQCIVVKDLSRLGRDYLTVGNYLSRVFPFLGVRFIAVNDGFDSLRRMDIDSLDTSFKILLHDFYSQDLSRKVRSAQYFRAEQGEFLSAFAPFGYVKNKDNKKKLVIDPAAAETVRRIFHLAAEGYNTTGIAKILNREEVPTPMQVKLAAGCSRRVWGRAHENNFWTHNMVLKILRDERYIGNNIYGKRRQTGVGSAHAETAPRKEWIVVENTHEGIVTREEFAQAAEKIRRPVKRSRGSGSRSLFYRKVRCGVCGYAMTRTKTKEPYYSCQTMQVMDRYACPAERIPEKELEEAVLTNLRIWMNCTVDENRIREEILRQEKQDAADREKNIRKLKKNLAELESRIQALYEQFATGELGKEEYLAGKAAAVKKKEKIAGQLKAADNKAASEALSKAAAGAFAEIPPEASVKSTAELLRGLAYEIGFELLQEVTIYPDGRLQITWRWQDGLRRLQNSTDKI